MLDGCGPLGCHTTATPRIRLDQSPQLVARLPDDHQKGARPKPMSNQHRSRMGVRIAELRKIHGATQQALAMRAKVSYSLLRKVERGERPASPSFIAAIARALSVSVLDITEQPYGARDAHPTSEQAGVPALRQALVEGDDPELDTSPRTLDDLRAAVAEIKEFDRRSKHAEVVRALPDVLRHLHRAVLDLPSNERPGAHDVLAAAYSYAITGLYRLGHLDLSHLADERARAAAAHGDDPLRAAAAEWNHSLILMFDGAYPAALRSIERADAIVDLAPATLAMPAVRGALHLRAAIIAARATNSGLAAARRPPSSTGLTATSPPNRSPTHPLPPASSRDRAHSGDPGCPIHRHPPELRRLVWHPQLTRQGS